MKLKRYKNGFAFLLIGCIVSALCVTGTAGGGDERVFYVAPQEIGDGAGTSPTTAANFRNLDFWSVVRQANQKQPIKVCFLDGTYMISSDKENAMPELSLADLGNKEHRLVLQGINKNGVVFTRLASDSMEGKEGPGFLEITRSQNLIVRNLHFTGKHPITYATNFYLDQNVSIEECSWIDLPGVLLGATGTSYPSTDHITYRNCVFKRVGSGGGAHMSYNANDVKHIRFIDCQFEDCAGDYIRYRAGADFGVVVGCTFKSTGEYNGVNMPFISVPMANDDDPLVKGSSGGYEYFGSHFLIANNTFSYATDKVSGERIALLFHHSGFDPPDRKHLLTHEEGELLANGSVADKRALMLRNLGIDSNSIHFFNNRLEGTHMRVGFRSYAAYGAKSKGWNKIADITDTVNDSTVVEGSEKALTFFD